MIDTQTSMYYVYYVHDQHTMIHGMDRPLPGTLVLGGTPYYRHARILALCGLQRVAAGTRGYAGGTSSTFPCR